MKAGKIHTCWLIVRSFLVTARISFDAMLKGIKGTTPRKWADNRIHAWIDSLLKIIKVRYEVVNPYNFKPSKGKPTILMCNHSSLYDIPLVYKVYPNETIRMLAKKEMAKIPFMGRGMKAAEFIFIDRKNRHQAIKDLAKAQDLMKSGVVIWMAPEGTRSKDGSVGKFKKGGFITAIQAQADIIPIGIRGAYEILPAKTFNLNMGVKAQMHVGKPIDAGSFSFDNKDDLIKIVRDEIIKLSGQKSTP